MKKILLTAVAAALLALTVFDSGGMFAAVAGAVRVCLTVIIPSLLPGMVISSYLLHSGGYRVLFKLPHMFLCRAAKLFGLGFPLTCEEFAIFMMSLAGGYPTGAKLLSESPIAPYRKEMLLPFCYCTSPVFAAAVSGDSAVYVSCAISCVFVCAFFCIRNRLGVSADRHVSVVSVVTADVPEPRGSFTYAVLSSRALYTVCAFICAFSVLSEALRFFFANVFGFSLPTVVYAVLEISRVTGAGVPAPVSAALVSFGGFCILGQTAALSRGIDLRRFLIARVPAALLSGVICYVFSLFAPVSALSAVFIPRNSLGAADVRFTQSDSRLAFFSLIMMTLLFVWEFARCEHDGGRKSDSDL